MSKIRRLSPVTIALVLYFGIGSFAYGQRTSLYTSPNSVTGPTVQQSVSLQTAPNAQTQIQPSGQVIAGLPAYAQPPQYGPNTAEFAAASWIYTPTPSPRILRIHDLINIRVDETAQTQQLGNVQTRKNATLDMLLSDWVRFEGGLDTIKPGVQSDGDQRLRGQENEVYRADANMRTRESMTFNISAEIADIRPNGLLVLSARKQIKDNDNTWELSLSGICRPQDVGPDNTILSRDIFELEIDKNEMGHVREGYSRGWLSKLYGKFKPF